MLWIISAAGGLGCLLGLWLVRVPLIAPISFVLIVGCAGIAAYGQWGLWATVWITVAAISALQAGYFVGLSASVTWLRAKAPNAILTSSHNDQRMI
jgi:hypothetical protein